MAIVKKSGKKLTLKYNSNIYKGTFGPWPPLLPWEPLPDTIPIPKPFTCECGSAKIGVPDYAPGHSLWCPVAPEEKTK